MSTTENRIPTVLTIAGSDPSGGAGIQADLKTFTAIGVYGAAVITALTAQNTQTVAAAMAVPADFVKQQLDSIFSDIRIDVVKLGMLPDRDICKTIAPYLAGCPVVCDPVVISTSGCRLTDDPAMGPLIEYVIPNADFLTPNYDELSVLYGKHVNHLPTAGRNLLDRFENLSGIILKGGHVDTEAATVTDTLLLKDNGRLREIVETRPRYRTKNTHGTGCTFAAAFAAYLAVNDDPTKAFKKSATFVNRLIAISRDCSVGHGNGPLLHHRHHEP